MRESDGMQSLVPLAEINCANADNNKLLALIELDQDAHLAKPFQGSRLILCYWTETPHAVYTHLVAKIKGVWVISAQIKTEWFLFSITLLIIITK